jgi:primosomal protein N' (replication factor Y)
MPIARGALRGSLHYFSRAYIPRGALVTVPLRGKIIPALVTSIEKVEDVRQDIRSFPYAVQKIEDFKVKAFFTEDFMNAVSATSKFYAGTLGNTLSLLVPKHILENAEKLSGVEHPRLPRKKKLREGLLWNEKVVFQGSDAERLSFYKGKVRESFAKKESIFLALPTLSDIEYAASVFEKGIQKYSITLHSSLPKIKLLKEWERALIETHPVLIIGTGAFLSVARKDIGTIIIDKESSPAYKHARAPYIDIPFFAEELAKRKKISLIVGDVALKTETVYEKEAGKTHPSSSIKYRFLFGGENALIDMTRYRGEKGSFKIISSELEKILEIATSSNDRTFFYVNRKGFSPYTVCSDCGKIHSCANCAGPLVLYKNTRGLKNPDTGKLVQTFYMCHACGRIYGSNTTCGNCGGWRLTPLGIGIEKVIDEIKKRFPKVKVFSLSSETVKDYKKGEEIIKNFLASPGAVLVGTEMALLYMHEEVEHVGIVSIDGLFATPDYRIHERALNILLRGKLLSGKTFAIQTRSPSFPLFEAAISGNTLDFYRNEILERKNFSYPPFTVLIKITKDSASYSLWNEMKALSEKLSKWNAVPYPTQYGVQKNKKCVNILLRIPREEWPNEELSKILSELSPDHKVIVNPAEIL